jgi:glycosyltransferase involved in cell wall biosynthesis
MDDGSKALIERVRVQQDYELLLPSTDESNPEVSIVVPALNEELTIVTFLDWCFEGIKHCGVRCEVLIVDSSSDNTTELALKCGARVLKVPKRGLGRAYIDALPHIRGKYVLMGDSDCTYDFRQISPFIEKLREGYEFVMGSRLSGHIEDGAMPILHRYMGTPVMTLALNTIFGQSFSDINCGMRGITLAALKRMRMQCQSWEYASEMIIKAARLNLRTTEIPINFFKDRNGRVSHLRRMGFLSPWIAAWISFRLMFLYGAEFFLLKPGIFIMAMGVLALALGLAGASAPQLRWPMLTTGALTSVLGAFLFYSGVIVKSLNDYSGRALAKWTKIFAFDHSFVLSTLACGSGVILMITVFFPFHRPIVSLGEAVASICLALVAMAIGVINFVSALILQTILYTRGDGM